MIELKKEKAEVPLTSTEKYSIFISLFDITRAIVVSDKREKSHQQQKRTKKRTD